LYRINFGRLPILENPRQSNITELEVALIIRIGSSSNSSTLWSDTKCSSDRHEFQAETRMLLDIVAKSLYSDKE
ncbi:hypothetical protein L9F63_010493, partial [Diploptera punctata]